MTPRDSATSAKSLGRFFPFEVRHRGGGLLTHAKRGDGPLWRLFYRTKMTGSFENKTRNDEKTFARFPTTIPPFPLRPCREPLPTLNRYSHDNFERSNDFS